MNPTEPNEKPIEAEGAPAAKPKRARKAAAPAVAPDAAAVSAEPAAAAKPKRTRKNP